MSEAENAEGAKSEAKAKGAKGGDAPPRSLSSRVERSLKDVDRLMKKSPETPPEKKAMVHLEQAKVSALLELADAIRTNKKS